MLWGGEGEGEKRGDVQRRNFLLFLFVLRSVEVPESVTGELNMRRGRVTEEGNSEKGKQSGSLEIFFNFFFLAE